MGRHKAMLAMPDQERDSRKQQNPGVGDNSTGGDADVTVFGRKPVPVSRLLGEQRDRYETLRSLTIREPVGVLRDDAVAWAAWVWAQTPVHTEAADRKECGILARFLYSEALTYQYVDVDRACTRPTVDRWLESTTSPLSLRSQRIYRAALYAAGRVAHPREFPAPRAVIAPRNKGNPAAEPGTAEALYAITPALPAALRAATLLVLDLACGAGLRPGEIKEITGDDIAVVDRPGGVRLVTVRVRRRGKVDRTVPVVDPAKAHRLIERARQAGPGPLFGRTSSGKVYHNAVNRVADKLVALGYPRLSAAALRHRYLLDAAMAPGFPAAAMLAMFGVCDMRVLVDRVDQLPGYTAVELADLLIDAGIGGAR